MINELNQRILDEHLPLAPLNDQGFSAKPASSGWLCAALDEASQTLRIYANLAPLSDAISGNARLLLSLLALTGPASPFGNVRMGADPRGQFLWASITIDVRSGTHDLRDALERFMEHADALRARVLDCINAVAGGSSEPAAASSNPAVLSGSAAEPETLSSDELSRLMTNSQIFWG